MHVRHYLGELANDKKKKKKRKKPISDSNTLSD